MARMILWLSKSKHFTDFAASPTAPTQTKSEFYRSWDNVQKTDTFLKVIGDLAKYGKSLIVAAVLTFGQKAFSLEVTDPVLSSTHNKCMLVYWIRKDQQ